MTKHLAILFLSMSFISVCVAQPTVTETGLTVVLSDQLTENVGNYLSPGSSGANQAWDLSAMVANTSATYGPVTPASTPYASSYTNATVALEADGNYEFYKFSSGAWQNYGEVVDGIEFAYSNPEDLLHFPFTYNNSYSDTWYCSYDNESYPASRDGITTVTADGYGTLTTPVGTFDNALRVHFVQDYTDSTDYSGYWYVTVYHNDEYLWFLNGYHYPLAFVTTFVTDGFDTSQAGAFYGTLTGVNELTANSKIQVYPVPAHNLLTVKGETGSAPKPVQLTLTDMAGRVVMQKKSATPSGSLIDEEMNLNGIDPGIYSLALVSDESVLTRKIIIQ